MKTKCCSTCKNKRIRTTDEPCNTCITEYSHNGVLPSYTPLMTNYDRIIRKTPEELARLFADGNCGYCRIHDFCFAKGCRNDCEHMWLDWLKEEEKE